MKNNIKNEKKKELLMWGILILIAIGCIYLMCIRAEQVNKWEEQYEERY